MEHKIFKDMVEAYGAAPARWPADMRDGAEGFAATEAGAEILRTALALDTALNLSQAPAPARPAFLAKLQALPQQVKAASSKGRASLLQKLRWRMPELNNWLRPGALSAQGTALATALVLGVWVGGQEAAAEQTPFDEELALLELTPQASSTLDAILLDETLEGDTQ